ncbi:quinone-dependent dihydroorotate dehydrogenase [Endothiovibrio diazotrophicus]
MLYSLIRPLLFRLDPERAHNLTLAGLRLVDGLGLSSLLWRRAVHAPVKVMGIEFPNRVGLAAGLDKDGDCIDGLGALGFGFVEVGTVTPRPQSGNERPRLFRLPAAEAVVNRMGFNNHGVQNLVDNVRHARYRGVIGVNIGKNKATPNEQALDDYVCGLRAVYGVARYVTVNISSPNTPGLRDLQQGDDLDRLLGGLKEQQQRLADQYGHYVPIAVKIAPDLDDAGIDGVAETLLRHRIDGVIATNTTLTREAVVGMVHGDEAGGLSGAPLRERSTEVVARLFGRLGDGLPIIAVGGILSAADAREKLAAGAQLVQLYTGIIYRGPHLVREVAEALAE